MSGEIWLLDPHIATAVRTESVLDEVWYSLCDSVGMFEQGSGQATLELPLASARSWLWWFALPEAGQWVWDQAVVAALGRHSRVATAAIDLLEDEPSPQWPEGIASPDELGIVRGLTDAQLRDAARLLHLQGGANFSVPGAGKTTVAYVVFTGLRNAGIVDRMLVLAPLSSHSSWELEPAKIFGPSVKPRVAFKPRSLDADVVVFNYEALESEIVMERLLNWCRMGPTLLVADEAHRVKAGKAGIRGHAALRLSRACARRMVMTGTPRPNSRQDIENVLELAYPGLGVGLARGTVAPTHHAFVRTTKNELGLPALLTKTENVPMSPAHEKVYQAVVDSATSAVIKDPAILEDVNRAGRIAMLLLQTTTDPTAVIGTPSALTVVQDLPDLPLDDLLKSLPSSFTPTKLVRAAQLVKEHAINGRKVLIWACFHSHVDRLRELLAVFQPAVITGRTPIENDRAPTDRRRELIRFSEDPTCKVLIATPHTLSEGISLHHITTHQIHIDRPYNAAMFLQSLDRTHRLGLPIDASCSATYLCSQGADGSETVDHVVGRSLDRKISAMAAILNDRNLNDLAFPSVEDQLSPSDLLFDGRSNQALKEMLGLM